MAISTVIAVSAAVSYESGRKQESAAKRAQKKQDAEIARQKALDKKQEAAEKKQQELLAQATPFSAGGAQARIGAEKLYARRSRGRGRTGAMKSSRSRLG